MQSISKFLASMVFMAIGLIESIFISRINKPLLKRAIQLPLTRIRETVSALSDGNPKNDDQVQEIWDKFAGTDLPDFAEDEIATAIDKVQDEKVKALLAVFAPYSIEILRAVTDEDKDNKGQVTVIGKKMLEDKIARDAAIEGLVIPWIEKNVKNEEFRDGLIFWLRNLDGFTEEVNATRRLAA